MAAGPDVCPALNKHEHPGPRRALELGPRAEVGPSHGRKPRIQGRQRGWKGQAADPTDAVVSTETAKDRKTK